MKLIDISIRGYKGISKLGLSNLAQVNYLIGQNGSGKSSLFEALSIPSIMIKKNALGGLGLPLYGDLKRAVHVDFELNLVLSDGNETSQNIVKTSVEDYQNLRFKQEDFIRITGGEKLPGPSSQLWLATILDMSATGEEIDFEVKKNYPFDLNTVADAVATKNFLNDHYVDDDEHVRNVFRSTTVSGAIELEITKATDKSETVRFESLKTVSLGYQQLLALFFVIRQRIKEHVADAGSRVPIICIEEPGSGLHPGLQKELPSIFNQILGEPGMENVVLLVATHSPFVISSSSNFENQKTYLINKGTSVNMAGSAQAASPGYSAKKCLGVAAAMLGAGFNDVGVVPPTKEQLRVVYCEGSSKKEKDSAIYSEIFCDEARRYLFVSTGGLMDAINSYLAARAAIKFVFGMGSDSYALVDRSCSAHDVRVGAVCLEKTSATKSKFTHKEREAFLNADPQKGYRMLKRKEIENYLYDPAVVELLPIGERSFFNISKLESMGLTVEAIDYVEGEVKDFLIKATEGDKLRLARLIRENKDGVTKDIYVELLSCLD